VVKWSKHEVYHSPPFSAERYECAKLFLRGTRWCSWLSPCATSRKVADSIPDGTSEIDYGARVDSGSNRNEYQRSSLRGKCGRYVGLTTLPPSRANCLKILEASTAWSPTGLSRLNLHLYLQSPVLS
jgi:hypothetical protein